LSIQTLVKKHVWKIIEKERVTGYSHRKPKKRNKKPPLSSPLIEPEDADIPPPLDIEPPKIVLKINTPILKLN